MFSALWRPLAKRVERENPSTRHGIRIWGSLSTKPPCSLSLSSSHWIQHVNVYQAFAWSKACLPTSPDARSLTGLCCSLLRFSLLFCPRGPWNRHCHLSGPQALQPPKHARLNHEQRSCSGFLSLTHIITSDQQHILSLLVLKCHESNPSHPAPVPALHHFLPLSCQELLMELFCLSFADLPCDLPVMNWILFA